MLSNLTHDNVGLLHLIFSIISVITGSMVFIMKKGNKRHKQVGYVYNLAMLGVVITAFMIYRLFGGFGLFHIAAIVSSLTLLAGMIPPFFFRHKSGWINLHIGFMYWSVMGLYAAFIAETMVRIPETPFFGMVGIGTGIVMSIGGFIFYRNRAKWEKAFAMPASEPKPVSLK